ncbi:helix-turn-helix domain-containing protein [Duganella hordei]|uniref:helix-turn-helix domain-containing protein n=1 Tax=Duganella hordei TaxID=2865934 RepID=UPI00333E32F9
MTPFGLALHGLRRDRRLPQKQLASMLELDQSYLSGLESGRKGSPPASLVQRLKVALDLSEAEASALQRAADLSRRKVEIPQCAEPDEYVLVYSIIERIGQLKPAQVRAIQEVLKC